MDSQDRAICVMVVSLLLTITIIASVGCITQHLTAEAAIKQGLVQGPFGRWVQPNQVEANQ
jgi:hypothetical protein